MNGIQKRRVANQMRKKRKTNSRQRKFCLGNRVRTIGFLVELLERGRWVYFQDRPKHPEFMWQMTLKTLKKAVNDGQIREAMRRDTG